MVEWPSAALFTLLGAILGVAAPHWWRNIQNLTRFWVCWAGSDEMLKMLGVPRFKNLRLRAARLVLRIDGFDQVAVHIFEGLPLNDIEYNRFKDDSVIGYAIRRAHRIHRQRDNQRRKRVHRRVRCVLCGEKWPLVCPVAPNLGIPFSGSCAVTPVGDHYCYACSKLSSPTRGGSHARTYGRTFDDLAFRIPVENNQQYQDIVRHLRRARDDYDCALTPFGRRNALAPVPDLHKRLQALSRDG